MNVLMTNIQTGQKVAEMSVQRHSARLKTTFAKPAKNETASKVGILARTEFPDTRQDKTIK